MGVKGWPACHCHVIGLHNRHGQFRRNTSNTQLACDAESPCHGCARLGLHGLGLTQSLIVAAKTLYSALQGNISTLMLRMEPGPGRQPGVACNKHQGRERKPQQSFQNPILHNMHQTTTSKQNKTKFPCHTERPEMAPEHRPINIRKHDRLHGSTAPNLRSTSPHPSSLSPKTKTDQPNTKTQGARSTHGGCPPQAL